MGGLTTHVLDISSGLPAMGMRIDFFRREGDAYRLLKTAHTDKDGRIDAPLLAADAARAGEYELLFYVADYFAARGVELAQPPFLDRVPLRFAISDPAQHYHVPLLCTPWSYSTYRGS